MDMIKKMLVGAATIASMYIGGTEDNLRLNNTYNKNQNIQKYECTDSMNIIDGMSYNDYKNSCLELLGFENLKDSNYISNQFYIFLNDVKENIEKTPLENITNESINELNNYINKKYELYQKYGSINNCKKELTDMVNYSNETKLGLSHFIKMDSNKEVKKLKSLQNSLR